MNRQQFHRRISQHIDAACASRGCTHQALASDWLERFDADRWKPRTLASHFSRLYQGRDNGLTFFFGERRRGSLLLDVLGVDGAERDDLLRYAAEHIEDLDDGKGLVVVDLTSFTRAQVQPLLRLLEEQLARLSSLRPVHVVVRDDQYEQVPRIWDDIAGQTNIHRTPDAATGEVVAMQLAGEGTLMVTPNRIEDFGRWAALSVDADGPALEPPDALALFDQEGILPELPELEDLVAREPDEEELEATRAAVRALSGAQLRRTMMWLARQPTHDTVEPPVPALRGLSRVALGTVLGTPTAASLEERLGLTIREEDAALWRERVDRATRRPHKTVAAIVDGTLHLLNPTEEQERIAGEDAVVARVDVVPNAMELLLGRIGGWTQYHFDEDPYLMRVIDELDPEGERRLDLLHARASLVWSNAIRPRPPEPVPDRRQALRELLTTRIPSLWFERWFEPWSFESYSFREGSSVVWLEDREGLRSRQWAEDSLRADLILRTVGKKESSQVVEIARTWMSLVAVPPIGFARVLPGQPLTEVHANLTFDQPDEDLLFLPLKAHVASDPARWADHYDGEVGSTWALRQVSWSIRKRRALDAAAVRLPLAAVWLALRAAARTADAVEMGDGALLLPLGPEHAAEIRVGRVPGLPVEPRVGIVWPDPAGEVREGVEEGEWIDPFEEGRVWIHHPPRRLRIRAGELAAEVRIRRSALLGLVRPAVSPSPEEMDLEELDVIEALEADEE